MKTRRQTSVKGSESLQYPAYRYNANKDIPPTSLILLICPSIMNVYGYFPIHQGRRAGPRRQPKLRSRARQYVTIARKAKGSGEWFVRNVSGEADHLSRIDFGFLNDKKNIGRLSMLTQWMRIRTVIDPSRKSSRGVGGCREMARFMR